LNLENLTMIEKESLHFLEVGKIQPRSIRDKRMVGAIATLKTRVYWKAIDGILVGFDERKRNS